MVSDRSFELVELAVLSSTSGDSEMLPRCGISKYRVLPLVVRECMLLSPQTQTYHLDQHAEALKPQSAKFIGLNYG